MASTEHRFLFRRHHAKRSKYSKASKLDIYRKFTMIELGLIMCVDENNLPGVRYWLAKGTDPRPDSDYLLSYASDHTNIEMVEELIRAGCRPGPEWCFSTGNIDIVRLLFQNGANINPEDRYRNPLMSSRGEVMKYLLREGADPNLGLDHGNGSKLQESVFEGYYENVELLLNYGADLNHTDKYGNISLNVAIDGNFVDIILLLLKAGADPYYIDKWGQTPITRAWKAGQIEIHDMMINYPKVRLLSLICISIICINRVQIPEWYPKSVLCRQYY